jgi:hypothetical protein
MMSGDEMDSDAMVKAMMVSSAMGGSFDRSVSLNETATDRSLNLNGTANATNATNANITELPPIAFAGIDAAFRKSKSTKSKTDTTTTVR